MDDRTDCMKVKTCHEHSAFEDFRGIRAGDESVDYQTCLKIEPCTTFCRFTCQHVTCFNTMSCRVALEYLAKLHTPRGCQPKHDIIQEPPVVSRQTDPRLLGPDLVARQGRTFHDDDRPVGVSGIDIALP